MSRKEEIKKDFLAYIKDGKYGKIIDYEHYIEVYVNHRVGKDVVELLDKYTEEIMIYVMEGDFYIENVNKVIPWPKFIARIFQKIRILACLKITVFFKVKSKE